MALFCYLLYFCNFLDEEERASCFTLKGKIRTFFKCINYKAYSMAEIIPH